MAMSLLSRRNLSVAGLCALVGGSGVLHFVLTNSYARIVPRFLPDATLVVQLSGLAEVVCAGLLAHPRTRPAGAWLTAALLLAVFPANVQMALDGGVPGASFPANSAVLSWLRLPAQVPLVLWALSLARTPGVPGERTTGE